MEREQLIIGVTGIRGAGKDTLAGMLGELYGFRRIAFADRLYQEVAEAFGVTVEFLQNRGLKEQLRPELGLAHCQDPAFVAAALKVCLSPVANSARAVLQVWGTEYRRAVDDDYWLRAAQVQMLQTPGHVVITDVRYRNEADLLRDMGGMLVRVVRPAIYAAWETDPRSQHPSERDLLLYPVNHTFYNEEGNPGALEEQMVRFMRLLQAHIRRDKQAAA